MDHLILRVYFSSPLPLSHPLYLLKTSCLLSVCCAMSRSPSTSFIISYLNGPIRLRAVSAVKSTAGFLPVLFHIWPCRPQAFQNYFLMEPNPKALRHFCCVCFSSSQRLSATVPSFYVKCFGCSAKSTSCSEKLGGRQLRHVYFNDLKDDQEWSFSPKKSNGGEHAHISHPLKRRQTIYFFKFYLKKNTLVC